MKNFEMNCPVEGTSALQPKLDSAPARRARIIAFPQHAVLPDRDGASIVSAVRTGSAQGVAFGRVPRWQAVVGGSVFAALALASLSGRGFTRRLRRARLGRAANHAAPTHPHADGRFAKEKRNMKR